MGSSPCSTRRPWAPACAIVWRREATPAASRTRLRFSRASSSTASWRDSTASLIRWRRRASSARSASQAASAAFSRSAIFSRAYRRTTARASRETPEPGTPSMSGNSRRKSSTRSAWAIAASRNCFSQLLRPMSWVARSGSGGTPSRVPRAARSMRCAVYCRHSSSPADRKQPGGRIGPAIRYRGSARW